MTFSPDELVACLERCCVNGPVVRPRLIVMIVLVTYPKLESFSLREKVAAAG